MAEDNNKQQQDENISEEKSEDKPEGRSEEIKQEQASFFSMSSNKRGKRRKKSSDKAHEKLKKDFGELGNKLNEINDKYLRLSAEFDNYRKRTLKEKIELYKIADQGILTDLLPFVDDFERAIKSMEELNIKDAVKKGMDLIFNKFNDFLKSKGIKAINAKGEKFDTDLHEAVTKFSVKDKKQKGKVIDVIEKGYTLNDKVIRFSKVVVGE